MGSWGCARLAADWPRLPLRKLRMPARNPAKGGIGSGGGGGAEREGSEEGVNPRQESSEAVGAAAGGRAAHRRRAYQRRAELRRARGEREGARHDPCHGRRGRRRGTASSGGGGGGRREWVRRNGVGRRRRVFVLVRLIFFCAAYYILGLVRAVHFVSNGLCFAPAHRVRAGSLLRFADFRALLYRQ